MEHLSVVRRWRFRQHYSIWERAAHGAVENTMCECLRNDSVEPEFSTPHRRSQLDPSADKLSHMLRQEAAIRASKSVCSSNCKPT